MTAITDPDQIDYLSIYSLRQALRAQARGMKLSRGRSALTIARERGLTNKRTVRGALVDVCEALKKHPGNPDNQYRDWHNDPNHNNLP